ncbi:MAG TPA: alpha/beta hydrolase [Sphingobium sp.]|nr:alpha/beta hydrolase [Sphingobium sp.]
MNRFIAGIAIAATALFDTPSVAQPARPTIVLVHGAFADASSWNGVIEILEKDGYSIFAPANPLRGLRNDADYISSLVSTIEAPVVLVGHSYGDSVISGAANGHANVKALVYVAAFAPEAEETAAGLSGKFPGSTLGPALAPPVALRSGGADLYVRRDKFHAQFAADVPAAQARLMAAEQRPIAEAALGEASGEPAWRTTPSWFVYGDADRNIPPQTLAFMAERARSRETVVVKGASHVVMVSNPARVAALIERAATAR